MRRERELAWPASIHHAFVQLTFDRALWVVAAGARRSLPRTAKDKAAGRLAHYSSGKNKTGTSLAPHGGTRARFGPPRRGEGETFSSGEGLELAG
jgi:hypothetical protein